MALEERLCQWLCQVVAMSETFLPLVVGSLGCQLSLSSSTTSLTVKNTFEICFLSPILTISPHCYFLSLFQSALSRSSQPLVGLRGRSTEDEQMIQCIVDANPGADVMYMIDTRPKV